MDHLIKKNEKTLASTACTCTTPFCFFCATKDSNSPQRRTRIASCFKQIALGHDSKTVLVLDRLFRTAMTQPNDTEFPSLGIFACMASLIRRGLDDREWLGRGQNAYIPYYAAHVIGSYTMNKPEFAERAVESGVVEPLIELLRGKSPNVSWVEQRVAIRALGHLVSHDAVANKYARELVRLAMKLASSCVDVVYDGFVGLAKGERLKYQCDLLTRGVKGSEIMENLKAEEWTTQIQCWSLHLLNCFAYQERCLDLICDDVAFLKKLCGMWGGLASHVSPCGVGLLRILCYSKYGRKRVAESREVIESLCNLSRSSDDWQYMSIDCLLLLMKDPDTRRKVIGKAVFCLADLVEIKELRDRSNLGESIAEVLLRDYKVVKNSKSVEAELKAVWDWKARSLLLLSSDDKNVDRERRVLAVGLKKQQAKRLCGLGDIKGGLRKYREAIAMCPLSLRRERMSLYGNIAQCELALDDVDSAIRDSTRALCLSAPANSHGKSLWTRSQAYDSKGLPKESFMDCVAFINGYKHGAKIPYYTARMVSKQMDATWLFAAARSRNVAAEKIK